MHLADALIQSEKKLFFIFFYQYVCVPWELNPQHFALLTQCSTTEPQEHCVLCFLTLVPFSSLIINTCPKLLLRRLFVGCIYGILLSNATVILILFLLLFTQRPVPFRLHQRKQPKHQILHIISHQLSFQVTGKIIFHLSSTSGSGTRYLRPACEPASQN